MTKIAEEIRAYMVQGKIHPLVAANKASITGLCMSSHRNKRGLGFCIRDYGHCGSHYNFALGAKWHEHIPKE